MKKIAQIVLFCCLSQVVIAAQTTPSNEDYSVSLVRNLMQYPANLGSGFTEKQLNRLGDRISIGLIKALDEKDFKNPAVIKSIMPLISQAFSYPQLISIPEDRNPKVTLFLLKNIEGNISDTELKQQITTLSHSLSERFPISPETNY
jgi:hypothetical protein